MNEQRKIQRPTISKQTTEEDILFFKFFSKGFIYACMEIRLFFNLGDFNFLCVYISSLIYLLSFVFCIIYDIIFFYILTVWFFVVFFQIFFALYFFSKFWVFSDFLSTFFILFIFILTQWVQDVNGPTDALCPLGKDMFCFIYFLFWSFNFYKFSVVSSFLWRRRLTWKALWFFWRSMLQHLQILP